VIGTKKASFILYVGDCSGKLGVARTIKLAEKPHETSLLLLLFTIYIKLFCSGRNRGYGKSE